MYTYSLTDFCVTITTKRRSNIHVAWPLHAGGRSQQPAVHVVFCQVSISLLPSRNLPLQRVRELYAIPSRSWLSAHESSVGKVCFLAIFWALRPNKNHVRHKKRQAWSMFTSDHWLTSWTDLKCSSRRNLSHLFIVKMNSNGGQNYHSVCGEDLRCKN